MSCDYPLPGHPPSCDHGTSVARATEASRGEHVGLGAGQNSAPVFSHRFRLDRWGRRGQKCRVLGNRSGLEVCIEFEDGERRVTSGTALRRIGK